MARLSSRKAKKILDFLAKRAGYEKALLKAHWFDNNRLNLFFCQGEYALNDYRVNEEIITRTYGNTIKIIRFHRTDTEKDVLEYLLKNKHNIYVVKGPLAKNSSLVQKSRNVTPWMNVFLETDSLEILMIKADLDG